MPPAKKTKKAVPRSPPSKESENTTEPSSMALVRMVDSATESEDSMPSDSRAIMKTPQKTPGRRKPGAGISQTQKNSMIENLKLEIAERSRRLRARYTTQAQYLRQQIEWRIDRVPIKLRNMTMGELLDQYANQSSYEGRNQAISVVNEVKRLSSGTRTTNEKENAPLVVAKKRVGKAGPTSAAPTSPVKKAHKALSPLRQLPQQQVKLQPQAGRRMSPVKKSSLPGKAKRPVAAKKEKKAASPVKAPTRGRAAAATGRAHRLSNATDTSAATTTTSSVYASTASKRLVKNVKSNGSFKENNDDGPTVNNARTVSDKTASGRVTKASTNTAAVKKAAASTAAAGAGRKRVLRAKK